MNVLVLDCGDGRVIGQHGSSVDLASVRKGLATVGVVYGASIRVVNNDDNWSLSSLMLVDGGSSGSSECDALYMLVAGL